MKNSSIPITRDLRSSPPSSDRRFGILRRGNHRSNFMEIMKMAGRFAGAALMILLPIATVKADPNLGLAAHWNFDEGSGNVLHDQSGNGNDGTIYGATWQDGVIGKSLLFDGVNDYVNIGNKLNNITVPFSVTAWIKKSWSDGTSGAIFSSDSGYYYYGFWLYASSSSMLIRYGDGGYPAPDSRRDKNSATIGFPADEWVFVSGVVRGPTNMDIYVNGANMGGTYVGTGGGMAHSSGSATIGNATWLDTNRWFKGSIDELRIYSRALDSTDVRELYELRNKPLIVIEQPEGSGLLPGTTVDFGSGLTGRPVARIFTVRNAGTADLTGIVVTMDGIDAADYALTSTPEVTLAPGATTTFSVTFTPGTVGARVAALHIASNDASKNPFNINLTGVAIAPVPPAFTSAAPPATGKVGTHYSHTCAATGTPPPTFSVTGLPSGLSISDSGMISGTPDTAGTFSGTITAFNGLQPDATQAFSIIILEAPLFTSTAPTPTGKVGTPYSHTATATGTPPPTFAATGLPAGLTMTAAGVISGTPTAYGTFNGTITASNGVLPNAVQAFSITIDQAPAFTSAPPPDGKVGTPYSHACAANGTPPISFAVTSGALPTGLTMSDAGVISGTPSAEGTFGGTLRASNGTPPDATQDFAITITQTPVLTLALGDTVTEGGSLTGQLSVTPARSAPLLVSLASSLPTRLSAGPPLTIPAGQTSVPITITGIQDNLLEAVTDARITATAAGATAAEATVTLLDDDWPILSLTLDRTVVTESAGPNAVIVTLTRDVVSSQPLTVWLTNSAPAAVTTPETVTIPGGTRTLSFPIGVVDNTTAGGLRTVMLGAEVRLAGANVISRSPTVSLEVVDDESARLEFVFERGWVLEGASATVTVRRLGGANTAPLAVQLAASPTAKLAFDATVEIPAGAAEKDFTISGVANTTQDGNVSVRLLGTANGYSPGETEVIVTDRPLPDLVASNGIGPASVTSEASFPVSYRIENRGSVAPSQPFVQRVLLSKDPVIGDDVVLSQYVFSGTLDAGAGFDRTESVRAPREAGSYWLLVVTDATQVVEEMVETNNTALFAQPLTVTAAYGATVQTAAEQVPANTPIVFTGAATGQGGTKVPNVMVNIHIRVAGSERIISAMTDVAGDFTTTWQPLPGEGGEYDIGVSHPGVATAPAQDTFAILTAKADFPADTIAFDEGASASLTGSLINPTSHDLTGVALAAVNAPAGLGVQVTLPATTLGAGQTLQAGVTLTGAAGFHGSQIVTLRLTTDQGVTLDVAIPVTVRQLTPQLAVNPTSLKASVLRGGQKTVSFSIVNSGGAASGPVNVILPNLAWLRLASPATLESIPPGGAAAVTLLLSPAGTEPLTLFNGNLVVDPAVGGSLSLPFAFRIVSAFTGDLQVEAVDEAYYFTAAAPKLAGATVTLRDAISSEQIGSHDTPANGRVAFTAIPEGWYSLEVTCPSHTRWQGNVFVHAGEPNFRQIFLSREAVSYSWTVEQVQLNDHYRISVQSTFETNVPAPVVTVTPGVLDVEDLTVLGQTKVINFTIENHGLIAAEHGNFTFDQHPFYEVTPLIADVGLIPAKSSITIPVSVRRIGVFAADRSIITLSGSQPVGTKVPCGFQGRLEWDFLCGFIPVPKWTPIPASGVQGDCGNGYEYPKPGSWVPGPVVVPGPAVPGSWGPDPVNNGDDHNFTASGDPVSFTNSIDGCGILGCYFNVLKDCDIIELPGLMGCGIDLYQAFRSSNVSDYISSTLGCICDAAEAALASPEMLSKTPVIILVTMCNANDLWGCIKSLLDCRDAFTPSTSPNRQPGDGGGLGIISFIPEESIKVAEDLDAAYGASARRIAAVADALTYVLGSREALLALGSDKNWAIKGKFLHAVAGETDAERKVTNAERTEILQAAANVGIPPESLINMVERWNLTIELWGRGIVNLQDAPADQRDKFIAADVFALISQRVVDAYSASQAAGYASPKEEFAAQRQRVQSALLARGSGVCATAKIKLDQQAVMTRSAFRGALELSNNKSDGSLTQVGFDLDIRDTAGNDARDLFGIQVSKLTGLAAIDGTGQIGPKSAGSAQWTLIPRDTAAPLADTAYTIGGTIRYDQGGTLFSIPVTAVPVTVKPDAALYLKYFHQRDVYADDPRTAAVEPSIPYALAAMVENRGAGTAHNLRITSAQPEIVDNEKGLIIDFQVIGTQVADHNLSPSLTADFGEIPPGQSKIATWWMTSSLQGLFTDYQATFKHLDGFGDVRLSLIKGIEIHEMIHIIEPQGALVGTAPAFLCNDVADVNDFPDTLHLGDGTTAPVAVYQIATVSGSPSPGSPGVTLTAALGTGWAYLHIPDPANGSMRLTGVQRSDGQQIPLDKNVWTTDRTFIGLGQQPIRENILHLVDFNSTGSYTLTYAALPGADVTPPSSRVAALPPHSGVEIPVTWSGTDDQGIATFDIFVQVDGGEWPPLPWLAATTGTSSIFVGDANHTYAFYSLATDRAGNREVKVPAADTSTQVTLINAPPVITPIPDQVIPEGSTFGYQVLATDPDGSPGGLRYGVSSDAPGIVIDSQGRLWWVTGEGDGGSAVDVTVTVTDAGIPPASSQTGFRLTVAAVNSPPVVQPVGPQYVEVGSTLTVAIAAVDPDVPVQTLSYAFAGNVPAGMILNPTTGVISWTPVRADSGPSHPVIVTVTDSGMPTASTQVTFAVSVPAMPDRPPVFEAMPALLWLSGDTHEYTVRATDPDGDPVTITADLIGLPGVPTFSALAGSGNGTLTWAIPAATKGLYDVPLLASAGAAQVTANLRLRVEPKNTYWEWAVAALGQRPDADDYDMDADPDGDGRGNVHEMVFLTNPLVADSVPLNVDVNLQGLSSIVHLKLHRRVGSDQYVDFDIASNGDLNGPWQTVNRLDWRAYADMTGDDDGRAETESIDFYLFETSPSGIPARKFYRVESTKK
jgi:hypothetical protein